MTIRELEEFLVGEKTVAEHKLGYNMCGKYARCLFCAQSDEYSCANAHERLEAAVKNANVTLPAWLLPEPPLDGTPVAYRSTPVTVKASYERTAEEMKIPMTPSGGASAQSEHAEEHVPFTAEPVAPVRARGGVLVRARTYDGIRLLSIRKKR